MKRHYLPFLLLFLWSIPIFGQQPEIRHSNGKFTVKNLYAPTPTGKGSKAPYWKYFWEFGDGHFSTDQSPRHVYQRNSTNPIRLHLTPYYSMDKYKVLSGQAKNVKTGTPKVESMRGKLDMQSSSDNGKNSADIVPGNAYQFVIQVKSPINMTQNGHLYLFYNKEGETGIAPFEKVIDLRPYSNGKSIPNAQQSISDNAVKRLRMYANSYRDMIGFEVFKMMEDEQRNFFFTIKAKQELDEFQDKDIHLRMRAVWLPAGKNSEQHIETMEYKMEVLAIHDPNRLFADKNVQYFRKNNPAKMDYTLQFQNEEKGTVNKVKVEVDMGKGIDVSSANIYKTDIKNYPPCNGDTNRPCYEVLLPKDHKSGQFTIVYHNLGLEGKGSTKLFESKKATKAKTKFTIYGSPKKEATSDAQASIYFDNVPAVKTRVDKITWRRKGFYVRGGLNQNEMANSYTAGTGIDPATNEQAEEKQSWMFGIGWQNAPLGKGWSRSFDIGVSRFNFYKDTLTNLSTDPNGGPTEFLYTQERLDIKTLDIRYGMGYQLNGHLKVFAAAGIVQPLSGKVNLNGWFDPYSSEGDDPTLEDNQSLEFAAWQQNREVEFMGQVVSPPTNLPGLSTQLGAEIGWLNGLSIGGAYEVRRISKSYNDKCLTISNLSLYAKLRLF